MLVAPALQNSSSSIYTGFIDWEYAKIGRGVSDDFAVLSAYFALMEIAAAFASETETSIASRNIFMYVQKLRYSMVLEYRRASRQEGALWQQDPMLGRTPDASDPRTIIFRSTMIAHGTEIIRLTVARRWKCGHTQCSMERRELDITKTGCKLLQRMIRHGLWYLCHAGADLSEFCGRENWEETHTGHDDGFWLLDLFL